jgi:hypothetical protein
MKPCSDRQVDKSVDSIEENYESPFNFHAGYSAYNYP